MNPIPYRDERLPGGPRIVLHVDMDAFFAAVEQQRRPNLRARPVVVGGDGNPHHRGVVSAASYEARRYGIHSAMPLREAWRRCPEAVFLPVDHECYERVSQLIMALLRGFCHHLEPAGLDEAYLDVTGSEEPPEVIARSIKRRIREETGLTASVGIGPNKLLAKLASDLEKPDGLTRLRLEDLPRRIWPLPPHRLWRVGPKTEQRLVGMGVLTIGDLARFPQERLQQVFGPSLGEWLHRAANGEDARPVQARQGRVSLSRQITFQRDIRKPAHLHEPLRSLMEDLTAQLQRHRCLARTITVEVRTDDFITRSRSQTLAETSADGGTLLRAARHCLDNLAPQAPCACWVCAPAD